MAFDRSDDVALCREIQGCISYILRQFGDYLWKHHRRRLPLRRIGHKNILIEQIWRGRAPSTIENIWHKVLNQKCELSLGNLVSFLSAHYPEVAERFERFQQISASLMERHRGLALTIAHKVAQEIYHVEKEDLEGEALLGVISAALRFKPSRGTNFSTYAYYVIRSLLIDYCSRAQRGISYSPSAYAKMKREENKVSVLSFSEIEEEDEEDGEISRTGDEVAEGVLHQQVVGMDDEFRELELSDAAEKLPPPFNTIALLVLRGEIESYRDLRALGFPTSLANKVWRVLAKLLEKYVLVA